MALSTARTGRRGCTVLGRLLATQPYLPFSLSPFPLFVFPPFPNNFLLHFVAFGIVSPFSSFLKRKSVLFFFFFDSGVFPLWLKHSNHMTGNALLRQTWGYEIYTGMLSLLFSKTSLETATSVESFQSQRNHWYTNNINLSKALFKNSFQTKHKHVCVLWSIGLHARKLNIQGREKQL